MTLKLYRAVFICLVILFLLPACTQVTPVSTPEVPTATIKVSLPAPTVTPSPTHTPVPASPTPEFTVTPSGPLEFIPFPAQVALQGEPFNSLDAYQFLVEPAYPATEMTWNIGKGEFIEAGISDGMLSAVAADPGRLGSEILQIEACEPSGRCAIQEISYAVLDPTAFEDVRAVFVGNSGFLISVGDKKVLIDAFQDGLPPRYVLPGFVTSALVEAMPPFDEVDMILVTHNHPDHFSPGMVRRYMQLNPEVVLVSTTQVVEQLAEFGERLIAVDPQAGLPVNVEANGIQVEALYLSHGAPSTSSETFNNAYVVTMDGVKLFHTGDTNAFRDVSRFNLAEKQIDLAFIVHLFMFSNSNKNVIDNDIDADYLIPIHYEYTVIEFSADQVLANYPEAVVFSSELDTWVMPKSSK